MRVAVKALALGLILLSSLAQASALLELRSERGQLAGMSWDALAFDYRPDSGAAGVWTLDVQGLAPGNELPPLDLALNCERFGWPEDRPACENGQLVLGLTQSEPLLSTSFRLEPGPEGYLLSLPAEAPWLRLTWNGSVDQALFEARLEDVELGEVPTAWLEAAGWDALGGRVTARLGFADGQLTGSLTLAGGQFDGLEGLVAAEGLGLEIELDLALVNGPPSLGLEITQHDGEILAGSVYLPTPAQPLALSLQLGREPDGTYGIVFDLLDPGSLQATGSAMLAGIDETWQLDALDLSALSLNLPGFWNRWVEGPAAAAGFGGLETAGRIDGSLSWRQGRIEQARLAAHDLSLDDPQGRLAVYGLESLVSGSGGQTRIEISWEAARLIGLPLGAAGTELHHDEVGFRMLRPLVIPLLDGALAVDGMAWLNQPELPSRLILDARIEPISLGRLTRALGLLEFGGTLAGRFPGVQYEDERLTFTGGMDIQAFSGHIRVADLIVERPFGSLPALAAQVEFEQLDLLEVTGAFNFGRMEGRLSGWARDLRLLNWRPVAMDARIFTLEDVPRRRISQRAVNNLSSLGGAGGAVISGTILRIFDDFPYRRVGLACRLSNNICHIDGVARHDSGGFLIVEGRGLPRLDVVGHRRLVDWPQMVQQLEAMIE